MVEGTEQPTLEALSPYPVEGEVADHPSDIGVRHPRDAPGRFGDEPHHDILNDILGERRTIQNSPCLEPVSSAILGECRSVPQNGKIFHSPGHPFASPRISGVPLLVHENCANRSLIRMENSQQQTITITLIITIWTIGPDLYKYI